MKLHSNRKFINDRENREKLNRKIRQTLKLKIIKIYLIVFILLWCFSSILKVTLFHFDNRDDMINKDFIAKSSSGDTVTVQWIRLWGDNAGRGGKGVAVDSSDNVYVIGEMEFYGYYPENIKNFLVKYDSSGIEQWNRTWVWSWGEKVSDISVLSVASVTVDSLDNVYVVGTKTTFGYRDMILMKYDGNGVQQWNHTWGGKYDNTAAEGMAVDSSDNVYVVGSSDFELGLIMVLVKYDSSGVLQWNRTWSRIYYDEARGVTVDSNDNVYIIGNTMDLGGDIPDDIVLVKYDSSGVQQWNLTWGGSNFEEANGVTVDSSDNLYITGRTNSFGAEDGDIFLVKYNSSGVQQWYRTWGGSKFDTGIGVAIDSSDNLYITGVASSFTVGDSDFWDVLVKYNSSGGQQWYRMNNHGGEGIAVDSSNNIYISGEWKWGITTLVKYVISNITVNFPNQLAFFDTISPSFYISTFDSNLDSTWYSLDGGLTNITFSGTTGTIDQAEWAKQGEGIVDIRFYMNNTNGKEEYVEVSVIKDISSPKITIIHPLQNETYGSQAPNYIISIEEPNFVIIRIFASSNIIIDIQPGNIAEVSGTFSQDHWDRVPQGEVTITFYVRDITDKEVSVSIVIIKDIPLRPPFLYFPLVLCVSIIFIGVAVYFVNRNRNLPKLTQEELDSL